MRRTCADASHDERSRRPMCSARRIRASGDRVDPMAPHPCPGPHGVLLRTHPRGRRHALRQRHQRPGRPRPRLYPQRHGPTAPAPPPDPGHPGTDPRHQQHPHGRSVPADGHRGHGGRDRPHGHGRPSSSPQGRRRSTLGGAWPGHGVPGGQVEADSETVRVDARCTAVGASCPGCGTWSGRVHGSYLRFPGDVPSAGGSVVLPLRVRRFTCGSVGSPAGTPGAGDALSSSRYLV